MANEIIFDNPAYSALVVYATIKNSVGQIYAGTTPETPQDANWTTYPVTMTEAGTTGIFRGTFPVLAAGVYPVVIRQRVGGTAAVTDPVIGDGQMNWNGTAEVIPVSQVDWTPTKAGYVDATISSRTKPADTQARVTLTDTATTLTNAPSDSSGVTTLLTRLTALRAGYLDNLSAGAAALEASMQIVLTRLTAARAALLDRIGSGTAVVTQPVTAAGSIEITQNADYNATDGMQLDWSSTDFATADFTSATVNLYSNLLNATGSVVTATGTTKAVRVQLTAAQTLAATIGKAPYALVVTLATNSRKILFATGTLTVNRMPPG